MNPGLQCAQTLIWCRVSAFPPQTKLLDDDFISTPPWRIHCSNGHARMYPCRDRHLLQERHAGSLPAAQRGASVATFGGGGSGSSRCRIVAFRCVGRLWHALAAAALATGTSVWWERDWFATNGSRPRRRPGLPQILGAVLVRRWPDGLQDLGLISLPCVWCCKLAIQRMVDTRDPYGRLAVSLRVAAARLGSERSD